MDEHGKPTESGAHGLRGPHRHRGDDAAGFVPLRLLLQPGGQAIELDRADMVVGRHTEADVRLPLPDVSRRHCRCFFQDGVWQVMDLNSLNGVYVNGEKVKLASLHHHDRITIGGFTFEIRLGDGPETEAVPQPAVSEEDLLQSIANAFPEDGAERRRAS
jgi:pSer/pThr/pTyr-binding forkhead associated (FHA) protein